MIPQALPQEVKDIVTDYLANQHDDDPAFYYNLTFCEDMDYAPVEQSFFEGIVEMREQAIATSRRS